LPSFSKELSLVRVVAGILALLLLAGWVVSELPGSQSGPHPADGSPWRRTRVGWERVYWPATAAMPMRDPRLHPAVVGALEMMASVLVLLAFSTNRDVRPAAGPPRHGRTCASQAAPRVRARGFRRPLPAVASLDRARTRW
jgi:hypothetical protein